MTDTALFTIGTPALVTATGRQGVIVGLDAHNVCADCHCTPDNPDHHNGTCPACPGPWYLAEIECGDDTHHNHVHSEVYAEHELTARCKKCGDWLDDHIDPAAGCAIWARDANGEVLTISEP